jgi:pimeloyl-ACP methyl ester carboxylesterase
LKNPKGNNMPFVDSNGIKIYYEEYGQGNPLLLVMGITARGTSWQKHVDRWSHEFRCILPDNRGVGLSDKPAGAYSTAQMADDHAGLLQALGIERARVVGCSMGGAITQQLALRHPHLVRSMVLLCTWARCDRYTRDIFRHLCDIKSRLRPDEFAMYMQLLTYAKPYWDKEAGFADLLQRRKDAANNELPQPVHGFEGQAAACVTHDTLNQLTDIGCPCLVLGGRSDIFTPTWMLEELAAGIPHSELHLYEGAGHAFHWECVEDFDPRVQTWLSAH